jgi:polysaccharide pyruvyl transferase CsaB
MKGKKMKYVSILGYYGYGNTGDEAILESIITVLNKFLPCEFIVFTEYPEVVSNTHNVEAIYSSRHKIFRNFIQIIQALSKSDMFIFGGGSILGGSYRQTLSWMSKILLAKMLSKPTVIYAVGVYPDFHKKLKILKRIILNNAVDLINVRDEESKKILENIGIKKVYLTVDPALCLEPRDSLHVQDILCKENIAMGDHPLIGICLRGTYTDQLFPEETDYAQFKKILALVIDQLLTNLDADVVFIPMRYMPPDNKIAFEILEIIQHKKRVKVITGRYTPQEVMGILGKMDMVIGMRLHSLILAAAMSVPMVGIVYHPKVKNFLLQLNQNMNFCDINNLDFDDLKTKIEITWQSKEELKLIIDYSVSNLKKAIIDNALFVCDLLKQRRK